MSFVRASTFICVSRLGSYYTAEQRLLLFCAQLHVVRLTEMFLGRHSERLMEPEGKDILV